MCIANLILFQTVMGLRMYKSSYVSHSEGHRSCLLADRLVNGLKNLLIDSLPGYCRTQNDNHAEIFNQEF
jgi:hypothetical protein